VEVLASYGKALAEAGRPRERPRSWRMRISAERPNWSVLSAQGSVADQTSATMSKRKPYYAAALKIAPTQAAFFVNLGLSYALSKKLPEAEKR